MHKKDWKKVRIGLLCVIMFWSMSFFVYAKSFYKDSITGYEVIIDDKANLLDNEEKQQLAKEMREILPYGNVGFVTLLQNEYSSTKECVKQIYWEYFGSASGTIFMIDMDYRNIWIYSDGEIYKMLTNDNANLITDNIYVYAVNEEYYRCAKEAFFEILSVLKGERISKPMKYISNLCLALVSAFIINYLVIMAYSKSRKPSDSQIYDSISTQFHFDQPKVKLLRKTKHYSPQHEKSDDAGGNSSSGSRGGSFGGGGGHSF